MVQKNLEHLQALCNNETTMSFLQGLYFINQEAPNLKLNLVQSPLILFIMHCQDTNNYLRFCVLDAREDIILERPSFCLDACLPYCCLSWNKQDEADVLRCCDCKYLSEIIIHFWFLYDAAKQCILEAYISFLLH